MLSRPSITRCSAVLAVALELTVFAAAAATEVSAPLGASDRLFIDCQGAGAPTVVFDAGLGGSSLEWTYVTERLRAVTRVCVFDRAGYGASQMGARPRTSSRIANELFLLLDDAGLEGPYVLVGHSFGGYNAQVFARRYAYLTVGVVLIDASHPEQVERFRAPPLNMITAPSSRFGIVKFRDPPPPHARLPASIKREIARRAKRWKTRRTLANELLAFRDSAAELKASPALGEIPLVVISRGQVQGKVDDRRLLMEKLWLQMQSELARESRHAAHLIALDAGHNVHIERPDVVVYGVALLVERYRRRSGAGAAVDFDRIRLENAAWLRDTLDLSAPDPGPARLVLCGADLGPACSSGAP
ncbi:MAG: alpha/beta fold hydrolase [Gammaproteobacteria bacterium]